MSRLPVRKKRKLSPPDDIVHDRSTSPEAEAQTILDDDFSQRAARWNLEQDYEQRPRLQKKKLKLKERLPIKTPEGRLELIHVPDNADTSESETSNGPDEPVDDFDNGEEPRHAKSKVPERKQILEAKEALAKLAASINEDPEERIGSLQALREITSSEIDTITKLGLATQLAVYKDLIPDYRIRPAAEDEMNTKVSKDVRKLRNFEQALVAGYQKYVQELARIASLRATSADDKRTSSLTAVAVSCACNLLKAVPHFNYRTELLRIAVSKLSKNRIDKDFETCRETLESLFQEDEEGSATLEAVSMLSKMVKARNHHVDERVLNLFLHLRLLTEFSHKASDTRITREAKAPPREKVKKQFRTKKERKIARERKTIEKEMREADAVVSHEQRDQMQAETLKLVFSIYFRILKARTPSLMGPVLEGLVKYAHLINQDFFSDLLEALKDLIIDATPTSASDDQIDDPTEKDDEEVDVETSRNLTRESLLCVITAFALLEGQDASKAATTLQLDLSFFIAHLYRTLYSVSLDADIEFSSKSLHIPDPHSMAPPSRRTKVDVQTTIVLLLRCLQAILLPAHIRSVSPLRLAAYVKQILTASLHMPDKSCTAILGTVNQVLKVHKKKVAALWNTEERRGDGQFDPLKGEIEGSNPFAATVWEGELLRLHYAPSVREGVKNIGKMLLQE